MSSYIGAIHEIFHKNALENPNAPCVTETASSTTPERRFNYKQIYEAPNILANQLHEAGITNGDVVMIFAYHSIELVIAAISCCRRHYYYLRPGVPARQTTYLPRGLTAKGASRCSSWAGLDKYPEFYPWHGVYTQGRVGQTLQLDFPSISHDPIQRDIFSPIFVGGDLIVPARENLAHERLAEWFRDHKPNTVHLTSAMGQILCGGAKAEFPSLTWVLYVRDILTKKDCAALRKLAPNAEICAAYGTTETSRSVSYYDIKSHAEDLKALDKFGDIVPAGRGIENVQLLVVKREDPTMICGEKFLDNWFVDNQTWVRADFKIADHANEPWRKYYEGPRDKIFTGRANDQAKVRVFRIELNEIDSKLRGHHLVRECKTLLRKDRDQEPTLVSYIVSEDQEWLNWLAEYGLDNTEEQGTEIGPVVVYSKRYRPMQMEIRGHLKSRLNAKTLQPESDFFECGGHSLLAQQLLLNTHKNLGANVSTSSLYSPAGKTTVFVTGVTGFLGSFIVKDLLER
ncbi:hypothetical protein F66182_9659 [Fusarium sp. NRRL 66182]|nr:hypothetical protein F66182_9659 [Fusarium sp. NRRL 66182]